MAASTAMTPAERDSLGNVLQSLADFRSETRDALAEIKGTVSAMGARIRSLEDGRLTDTTTAAAAAATAVTAAAAAAAVAVTTAATAAERVTAHRERSLSVRAWVAIGFAAASSTILALLQVAQFLRGANL